MSKKEIAEELKIGGATVSRYRKLLKNNDTPVSLKNKDTPYTTIAVKNNNDTPCITKNNLEDFKFAHGGRTPTEQQWLQDQIDRVKSINPNFFDKQFNYSEAL